MVGKIIESFRIIVNKLKGNLAEGIVYNEWLKIWNMDLNRTYTADFEIYDEKHKS